MRFITALMAAYRNFSTKSVGTNTKSAQNWYQSKKRTKKREPRKPRTGIKWTDEQKQIISAVSKGNSVFVTGSGGTGKTLLVEHIIKVLKKCHRPSRVFATASTGVAACAIGGQTLHSFAGIGYPVADRQALLDRVLNDSKAYKRWNKVDALVIDEISMVDAELFESLEFIAKEIRDKHKMWGGIQLVVFGDFFQLPPVLDPRNSSGKEFAFEADCWDVSFNMQFELTKIFRQSDPRLVKLLQGIRRGEWDPQGLKLLEQASSDDPSAIQLYPLREDVNRVNEEKMESLSKTEKVIMYSAFDSGENPWKSQLKQGISADDLFLCRGARVMLIKNLNTWQGLVNGATGTVSEFFKSKDKEGDVGDICSQNLLPLVKFDSGRTMVVEPETWVVMDGDTVVAERKQLPLLLAWALSIHKCQGMTLEKLYTDLSKAFGCGMVYVALSRVRSLEGLHLKGLTPFKIKADPKVLQFYQSFSSEKAMEGKDGDANQIGGGSGNLLLFPTTKSQGAAKYRFSLSEYLSSRQKRKGAAKYHFSLSEYLSSHQKRK